MGEHFGSETGPGPVFARFSRPYCSNQQRIAVLADPHIATDAEGTWKVFHRTAARFKDAIDHINQHNIDYVLIIGDLTKDGATAEFELFDELVEPLIPPFAAIPGNHDVPKNYSPEPGLSVSQFSNRYPPRSIPFQINIGDLSFIGLNSVELQDGSLSDSWAGEISESQLIWLEETLPVVDTPIVFLHHNLAPLREHPERWPWEDFSLGNTESLVSILTEYDVPLVVSGHHHVPFARTVKYMEEIMTPAVCSFPQAYFLLDIDKNGTVVRFVPLADDSKMAEAYFAAKRGDALGQGILELVETRLAQPSLN